MKTTVVSSKKRLKLIRKRHIKMLRIDAKAEKLSKHAAPTEDVVEELLEAFSYA